MDELLAQYGPDPSLSAGTASNLEAVRSAPWWTIQDGGGDVVAVIKDNGYTPGTSVIGGGNPSLPIVAGQWVYDAYGNVLFAETLAAHPVQRVGHKGLFFDKLDEGALTSGGDEPPRLVTQVPGSYYMRNRWYLPQVGRFMQRDPNATAMVLVGAASHGRGMGAAVATLDPTQMFGDGHNLYQYLQGNPWLAHDAMGLSSDPFADVDNFTEEFTQNIAKFFNDLGRGLLAAATLVTQVIGYLPIPGAALLGDLANALVTGRDIGPILSQAALGLVPGGKLLLLAEELVSTATMVVAAATELTSELLQAMQDFIGGGESGPAMAASKTEKIFSAALAAGRTLASVFEQDPESGDEKYTVYVKKKKYTERIYYVGITNNLDRRSIEHKRELHTIAEGLSKLQARAMETAIIVKYGIRYDNKIKSIGEHRRFYDAAVAYGTKRIGRLKGVKW